MTCEVMDAMQPGGDSGASRNHRGAGSNGGQDDVRAPFQESDHDRL